MDKIAHNPTPWLQHFGINHAIEVRQGQRLVFLSGQTASAADGAPLHPGDLVAQYRSAWENLLDALAIAGMGPENIVRCNFYTTDVAAFMAAADAITAIHIAAGAAFCSTLLGVNALYHPDILIEIEATAIA